MCDYNLVRTTRRDLQEVVGRNAAELTARYGHRSHRTLDGEDIVAYTVQVRTRLQWFSEFVNVIGDGLRTVHIEFDRHAVIAEDLTTAMTADLVVTAAGLPTSGATATTTTAATTIESSESAASWSSPGCPVCCSWLAG